MKITSTLPIAKQRLRMLMVLAFMSVILFGGKSTYAQADSCLQFYDTFFTRFSLDDTAIVDTILVDECSADSERNQLFARQWWGFEYSFDLIPILERANPDTEVTWEAIDVRYAARAGFDTLQEQFGDFLISKVPESSGDTTRWNYRLRFLNYVDYRRVLDSLISGVIDSGLLDAEFLDYPESVSQQPSGQPSLYIWPQPAYSVLNVQGNHIGYLKLMNALGETIRTWDFKQTTSASLDIRNLPASPYFLEGEGICYKVLVVR